MVQVAGAGKNSTNPLHKETRKTEIFLMKQRL